MDFTVALMRRVWHMPRTRAANTLACGPGSDVGDGALSWKEAALQVPCWATPMGGPFLPVGQAPPPPPAPEPGKWNVIWVLPPLFLTAGHLCGTPEVCHRHSSRREYHQPTSTHRTDQGFAYYTTSETYMFQLQTLHCFFIFLTCFLKRRKPDLDFQ